MKFKGLSLFANVGIGETYLKDIGYPIVLANELLKERCEFYKHQNPDHQIIQGDITDHDNFSTIINTSKNLGVNFILATPPCQGMSLLGKQENHDPRNLLITRVFKAIELLTPEFCLVENVPQMYKCEIDAFGNGKLITIKEYMTLMAKKLDYNIEFDIFNAADYGTPQHRKRAFTRIFKNKYSWKSPNKQPWITVRDAIGDLPSLKNGEDSGIKFHVAKLHNPNEFLWLSHTPTGCSAFDNKEHFPKTIRYQKELDDKGRPTMKVKKVPVLDENGDPTGEFQKIPEKVDENGNPVYQKIKGFHTTYTRMHWDKPSPAITMNNGSIGGQQNVHPGNLLEDGTYSDARVLTRLELFRLMGLPDDWNVPDWASDGMIRKVIGEAIPPRLTKAIVSMIEAKPII